MEQQLWDQFVHGETKLLTKLPTKVANSWKFCLQNNVDPFLVKPSKILTQSDLVDKQQKNNELISIVREELKKIDSRLNSQKPLFVLTDDEGIILWRTGNYQAKEYANEISFHEGSAWTELEVGTNAIALVMQSKQEEVLGLEEHYAIGSRKWSCAAAPIFDETNELVGVLDVSTYRNTSAKELSLLLSAITQRINNKLMKNFMHRQHELLEYANELVDDAIYCDSHHRIVKIPEIHRMFFHIGEIVKENIPDSMFYEEESIYLHHQLVGYKYKLYQRIIHQKKQETTSEKTHYCPGVVSESRSYNEFLTQVFQIAPKQLPVHIYGESGSGKEVISKTIHGNSLMKNGPMVAVNCGAVSENLLESELFGYAPGAFTGASNKGFKGKFSQANGGTLFLDEIDSMSEKMQKSLLRVLEDKLVTPISGTPEATEFRLVTASNKDLRNLVREGKFREDLFYRIFVYPLHIPPLRERMEDLAPLMDLFFANHNWDINWKDKLLDVAIEYEWYGNIREFNNFLARVMAFYQETEPTRAELWQMIEIGSIHSTTRAKDTNRSLRENHLSEKEQIQQILLESHFNMTRAAEKLAVSRATLYRKLKKFNLSE